MNAANLITKILVVVYMVLAVLHCWGGEWAKVCYWAGAALLTFGILGTK